MDKLVSVIVPVYNVSKYIDECVASLVNQTYTNLEILLVNDGSEDNSGELCDAWAEKDSRIRVIHKPNGGAASARNAGLDTLTGDLVCFVDGDDTVEKDYVFELVQAIKNNDADASVSGFYYWTKSEKTECKIIDSEGVLNREEFMIRFLNDWSCSLLWNKIFPRDAIGDIRMDEGHKVDDEFFTYQVCMNCKRVVVIPSLLYNYRMRASSVMQDTSSQVAERYMLDRIAYNIGRLDNVYSKMPQISKQYFQNTLDTMARYWTHSKDMPIAQSQIRKWVNGKVISILTSENSLKQKIGYLKHFYINKPTVAGEPITISFPSDECFE